MKRRLITLLVVVLACLMLAVGYYYIFISRYQVLSIDVVNGRSGYKLSLYESSNNDEVNPEVFAQKQNLVKEFISTDSFKLKKGNYVIVGSGKDFVKSVVSIKLANKEVRETVQVKLTDDKLQQVLKEEFPSIVRAIQTLFPEVSIKYEIAGGRLFENGSWFGTTLSPIMSEEMKRTTYFDIYRLVARKQNGKWDVVTKPPELVLSRIKYPGIPFDVLSETNKLSL